MYSRLNELSIFFINMGKCTLSSIAVFFFNIDLDNVTKFRRHCIPLFRSKLDYEWSLFRLVRRAWRERKPREKMAAFRGTTRSLCLGASHGETKRNLRIENRKYGTMCEVDDRDLYCARNSTFFTMKHVHRSLPEFILETNFPTPNL